MTGRKETKKSLTPGFISEHMQFIADAMLGRLARWLRFPGFDVLYTPGKAAEPGSYAWEEKSTCSIS